MTTQVLTAAAFAALALTVTANAQAQMSQTPQTMPSPPSRPETVQRSTESTLARSDRGFLDDAAQAGQFEIEGSKMALQKSGNEEVKQFAQRMIDEHGRASEELAALAAKKNHSLPTGPSVMQQGKLKALDVRSDSFDQAYVDQIGISAHEDAVKLFQKASSDVKDPEVKAFAAKTLPTLQSHLQMAQRLKRATQAAK